MKESEAKKRLLAAVDDDEAECSCCGYGYPTRKVAARRLKAHPTNAPIDVRSDVHQESLENWRLLCDICAGTLVANYNDHQTVHDSNTRDLMKVVAYVGNAILEELRKADDHR